MDFYLAEARWPWIAIISLFIFRKQGMGGGDIKAYGYCRLIFGMAAYCSGAGIIGVYRRDNRFTVADNKNEEKRRLHSLWAVFSYRLLCRHALR